MITDRHTDTGEDDSAPVDTLVALFEARGWPYELIGEDELSGEVQGAWAKYQMRAIWRREDNVLQLLCLPEVRVGDDKRTAMFELLSLVNEQIWLGHFDLWSSGSVLLYRHGMMLGDDGLLSIMQAQMAVEHAVEECDRFYPAFQFVLWGGRQPQDALDAALIDAAGEA
ncbi:YbjN domain-containing protein [Croceicoccus pelagius]|uniref:YbjN domain-containing protein n=1 Tax=Croceicoccus pelagius TaxID=1703341 RepID=A0A916YFU8_9SPHN|nr:YbjN domain-containing protein [Croceicoccus pelagius]GGD42902.1 hypothetical protein GCM10010989_16190 [Croceicoccus pelagius]